MNCAAGALHTISNQTVCFSSPPLCLPPRAPTREDIVEIVHRMYAKDGLSRGAIEELVDTFPNQRESQRTTEKGMGSCILR